MSKTQGDIIRDLHEILEETQINLSEDDLYEASLMFCLADHVRKVCSYDC